MSVIDDALGEAAEIALHTLAILKIQSTTKHGRGLVVPLTAQQRVQRALYLAKLADKDTLDPWVRASDAPLRCPDGYYLLRDHNGGKDPTAPDPFDRWTKTGSEHVNRTADCIGGASWIGGWDRYQPIRFPLWSGWINTDSMRLDAGGMMTCFVRLAAPSPGCYVVAGSGSRGHKIGHIGTVVGGVDGFVSSEREAWERLEVVDVASRGERPANQLTTGRGWFDCDAWFVVPVMKP